MAGSKNVVFVGMTQNGKSSLLQSILRYCGEDEKADSVAIGDGNFAETQHCMFYDEVKAPIKTHRLKQLSGPRQGQNSLYVVPGEDFDLEDAYDYELEEVISDSGQSIQLTLIDTPGLSDSANNPNSSRGLGDVDERHKLRILFALQKLKEVHAICFVVRRDTHYGGDFKDLIKSLVDLLTFSLPSTTWNLSFHVIHTNIDIEDRAGDLCRHRQADFNAFGPDGAKHHFIDNMPDKDSPLETFYHNAALSSLFQSLSDEPSIFKDLRFPKSAEIENLDQDLTNMIQRAINELQENSDKFKEEMRLAEKDIERITASADMFKKRMEKYDKNIQVYDSDSLTDIDGEQGDTEKNVFGGGARTFTLKTNIPIAKVEKTGSGWVDSTEKQETYSYSIRLQPSWMSTTSGSIKLKAKKKDKHRSRLDVLRMSKEHVSGELKAAELKIEIAKIRLVRGETECMTIGVHIDMLKQSLKTIRKSGGSIVLSEQANAVKFFTLDTPISISMGYNLSSHVPWTVASLKEIDHKALKERLNLEFTKAQQSIDSLNAQHEQAGVDLGRVQAIRKIAAQLSRPGYLETARLDAASRLLPPLLVMKSEICKPLESVATLFVKVKHALGCRNQATNGANDPDVLRLARVIAEQCDIAARDLSEWMDKAFDDMQRSCKDKAAALLALTYFGNDYTLPIGAYTALMKAPGETMDQRIEAVIKTMPALRDLEDVILY